MLSRVLFEPSGLVMYPLLLLFLFCAALPAGVSPAEAAAGPTPLWGRWEQAFTAPGAPSDIRFTVELTAPSGRTRRVDGFWDGGDTWRARFMPTEAGPWKYRTHAVPAAAGLDGRSGEFNVQRGRSAPVGERFLRHGPVRTAENGRYLEHADATPFFWLGDTAWNGALLSTESEWEEYLRDRKANRFTAIQVVMTPWRTAYADEAGQVAYTGKEKIEIQPAFFQRLDRRIDAINRHGMLAVPVLEWAIAGAGSEHNPGFALPEDQAIRLARYMTARYGSHHVIWILAGDANYDGAVGEKWRRIGRAVFDDPLHAPAMVHPGGMQWHLEQFRGERWNQIFGYQSGHGDDAKTLEWIHSGPPARMWKNQPPKVFINLEPPYEDHLAYQSRRPHDDYSVRRAVYWSLLNAPTAGVTYGAHGVWSWEREPAVPKNHARAGVAKPWREALKLPGNRQMALAAQLFTGLPWHRLEPAPEALAAQPGTLDPARFISVSRTPDGKTLVAYVPVGGELDLKPEQLQRGGRTEWFDPRTGKRTAARDEGGRFRTPDERDWVLVNW